MKPCIHSLFLLGSLLACAPLHAQSVTATGDVSPTPNPNPTTTWDTGSGNVAIGANSSGTLTIVEGGTVTIGGFFTIGAGYGKGDVTVTGAGSALSVAGSLAVGYVGTGQTSTLTIADGAAVSVNGGAGTLSLAASYGSKGELNFGSADLENPSTSGALGVASIVFGEGDSAVLNFNQTNALTLSANISQAGFWNSTIYQRGTGTTTLSGSNSGYQGDIKVNDGTLVITGVTAARDVTASGTADAAFRVTTGGTLTAGDFYIANEGGGNLLIDGGGQATNGVGSIGADGHTGQATVTGAGSRWTLKYGLLVGNGGDGTLTIADGAHVTVSDYDAGVGQGIINLAVNSDSTGTLDFGAYDLNHPTTAGTLTAASIVFGDGYGDAGAGAGVINFNQTDTLILAAAVSGHGTVNQRGTGTTILTGDNTYTGLTTVSGGALQIGNGGTSGRIVGDIENNASLVFDRSDDLTHGGAISGTGGVVKLGGGRLTLTAAHTYEGETTVQAGALEVSGGGSITHAGANLTVGLHDGDDAGVIIGPGASVSDHTGVIGWLAGSTGHVSLSAGGTWTNAGELRVGDSGAGTFILDGGAVTGSLANIAREAGSTGTVTMNGGTWNNTAGLFVVGNQGTATFIQNGGIVNTVDGELGRQSGGIGTATVSGGAWVNTGDLYVGKAGAGTLDLIAGGTVTAGNTVRIADAADSTGTLNFGAYDSPTTAGTLTASSITFGSGTGVINFNQTDSLTLDANISGGGAVNQRGSGTTILTGTNTYAGLTTVEAGTLFVDGSITSAVTVQSGATLGGDGIVGDVTLESGATLGPVNSLHANSLMWNPGATLVFSLGSATSDLLDLSGDFTMGGAGVFAFTFGNAGWQVGQTYTLIFFGGATNFDFGDFTFTNSGGFDGVFAMGENSLVFQLTAIPEPSTYGLIGLGLLGLAAFRRIRMR